MSLSFEMETLYRQGLKYTISCWIMEVYQVDEDKLTKELIDAAFGC